MNDRFEFRVWDKKNERYIQDRENVFLCPDGELMVLVDYVYNTNMESCSRHFLVDTIEQCTGLKDKNGKLIYENDFVRMRGLTDVYIIKWVQESCEFIAQYTKNSNIIKHWYDIKEFEIIGNIHENSDLLK